MFEVPIKESFHPHEFVGIAGAQGKYTTSRYFLSQPNSKSTSKLKVLSAVEMRPLALVSHSLVHTIACDA